MEQFKKNAAVIVLGVIAAAMLIGNICFVVFAKSSVKKATITKQEVKTVAGKDVRYEEDSDNFEDTIFGAPKMEEEKETGYNKLLLNHMKIKKYLKKHLYILIKIYLVFILLVNTKQN